MSWSLLAVAGPTPQSRSTGSGCRKSSSPCGGTRSSQSGLATPLATLARNFVRAIPIGDRQPDAFTEISDRSRAAISVGVPDRSLHAANLEEGFVDGQTFDERRGVLEHRGRGSRLASA